jgi:hypothetical protein
MATMATPTTTRMRRAPRVSSVAHGEDREGQYDLLTAALMGMAVGAGITFMLRRGPSGRRPISPAVSGAGRGLAWAGKRAWKAGREGASWAGDRGGDMWEKVPRDEIRRSVQHGLSSAKDAIDDAVEAELRALRRSIRRRRKQLGL